MTTFLGLEYETDLSDQVSLGGDLSLGLLLWGLGVEYLWLIALGYLTDPTPSDYRILPIRSTPEVG